MDINEFDEQDPLFRLYRRYDKLSRRNLVPPLRCKVDNTKLVTMLSPEDTLQLKCFYCGSIITPGSREIDAVKKAVGEYFE